MFRKLAEAISIMNVGEVLQWRLNDNNTDDKRLDVEIILGVKVIREFDSTLAIIGAYGGGFNSILWLDDCIDIEAIENHLETEFKGCKFISLG